MFGRKKNDETIDGNLDAPRRTGEADAEVVLHEERLVAQTSQNVAGHVRVSKRTVTQERVVTVEVSHEVLVVEHLDADGKVLREEVDTEAGRFVHRNPLSTSKPAHELVLFGDDIEIVKTRRPLERVKVYVDKVTDERTYTDEVRREEVDVEHQDLRRDGNDLRDVHVDRDGDVRR